MAYIISSGMSSRGIILQNNSMTVLSGGTVNSITVNSGGSLIVSSGGTAVNITWTPCVGRIYASDGATVTYASSYSGVYYGSNNRLLSQAMTMDDRAVNGNGKIFMMSGGIANNTIINTSADFNVYNGGTANNTIMSGGWGYVYSGGTANSTTINAFSHLFVYSGGVASNTNVYTPDGVLEVSSGGSANHTTLYEGGRIGVSSGGMANDIMFISGVMSVWSGGTANNIIMSRGYGYFGGTVINTTVAGGCLELNGVAKSTTLLDNGKIIVCGGGYTNSNTVNGGSLFVSSGGTASSNTINSGGSLIVSSGGTARSIIENGGFVSVAKGATVTFVLNTISGLVLFDAAATVHSKTIVNGATVNSGGNLIISSGGTANSTTVNSNGNLSVSSGGTATIVFNPWQGNILTEDTAVVTYLDREEKVYLGSNGCLVSSTEILDSITVTSGFSAIVLSGIAANGTVVSSCGNLHISNGGLVDNGIIYGSGYCYVSSGGLACNIKVYAGGNMKISSGAVVAGKMTFLPGAVVTAEKNAVFRFDITEVATGGKALLSDWSLIQGTPDYTITVKDNQETGVYKLADAADDFEGTITVQNVLGESLGTLALGQTVTIGDTDYTLSVKAGTLSVALGTIAPPPAAPTGLMSFVVDRNVALVWNVSTDDSSGVKEYVVKYSLEGQEFTVRTVGTSYVLKDAELGTYAWSVRAVDAAGNESEISVGEAFTVSNFEPYIVEYSTDSFEHILRLKVSTAALDSFRLPTGTYEWRIRSESVSDWQTGDPIVSVVDHAPEFVQSDGDGNDDLFFANPCGTWEAGYFAQHVGSINDWAGTNEYAALSGKNKLADIFEGSDDANILLLTDDANGDALFVDDIYTALPGTIEEQQARIARINEIRAGAGDDIIDMTSQRFEYVGGGQTLCGGDGNDVIWANKGANWLFGDAGDDRIVGASGNDVITGGIGDDRMHGGGGDDVFTFCENWGADTVKQLAGGSVTLWFASGSIDNWDEETLTYSDGTNSVKVSGVTAEQVTLKFGAGTTPDDADQFASLSNMGAFEAFTTRKIFEEATLA